MNDMIQKMVEAGAEAIRGANINKGLLFSEILEKMAEYCLRAAFKELPQANITWIDDATQKERTKYNPEKGGEIYQELKTWANEGKE